MEKPECCIEDHLEYLDDLRESGVTNMFVAGSWLSNAYKNLTRDESNVILSYWMKTFGERHKVENK